MKPLIAAVLAVGALWLYAQKGPDNLQTAALMPSGAIFYVEAKDFHRVLTEWNGSGERRRWLKSDNATVLSQSRLLQRLMEAQIQFATVAEVPVEMNMVNELAGTESAMAFYEFSTLRFVYMTRMDGTRLDQSELWKNRKSYQPREAAGIPFYLKTETDGHQSYTVSFASHDGWMVVATDAELMARTLALLAGKAAGSVSTEAWYKDTVAQAPQVGDLRLVYNFTALRKSPQFRTYWIQRNQTDLAAFTSGSADLFELPAGFEERRVLLGPTASEIDGGAFSKVVGHIPQSASVYRAWANPNRALVRSILQQVVVSDPASGIAVIKNAPQVSGDAPIAGSESDLETRIDQPPFQRSSANNVDALTDAVMAMEPKALLHSQVTHLTGDRVFVLPESEVALACAKPDRPALDKALQSSINVVKTGSLDPLTTSDDNGVLLLSRLTAHTTMATPTVVKGETYLADYEHASEWPRYRRLFGVIDHKTGEAPAFFSSNLQSLGDSLYRLRRISMTTQQEGEVTRDTVRYEFLTK